MSDTDREIAQKTQERFEFYIIALVFTLLALSIQTAEFGSSAISDSFELLGWISLVLSGIAGLWRMEFVPIERMKLVQRDELQNKIFELKELQLKGANEVYVLETQSNQAIEERIKNYREGLVVLESLIKKFERRNMVKYYIHRYLFVAGVLSIVISRGFIPAQGLIERLGGC